jgi:MarR family transcriptional regulator, 2-MHQ and catechol-resistance regulon repressor
LPTHYSGDDATRRALDAYIKLSRATKALWSQLGRALNEYDLTLSQLGALEALHFLGPMCQKDIGEKLLVTGGNITMIVNNLEKRGLVRRARDRQDRREITVSLTESGEALMKSLFPQHAEQIVTLMSVLDADEQDQLGALCKMLGLQDRDD